MGKKIRKIIKNIFIVFILIVLVLSIYINNKFQNVTLEQLIYSALNSQGTSFSAIIEGIIFVIIDASILFLIILLINKSISKISSNLYFCLKIKDKIIKFNIIKNLNRLLMLFIILFSIIIPIKILKVDEYIKYQFSDTKLFDEYYIDPKTVNIDFPEEKQNLIYIYIESLEMTNASIENGGALKESYIPNLESLALKYINFSNTSKLGGALQVNGTTWTAAAMIAGTSGVPLKLSIDVNTYTGYSDSLPGVYSLGEILENVSYKNYLMIGSKAEFGGRKDYFLNHGNYTIYDYNYAIENGLIDKDYYVWWGYEDSKLYSFAKEKLKEISSSNEPFNFTILTADTHFVDGYLDKSCDEPFDSAYANSFYCGDTMINEFISWIKKQDFYYNTTIIITGDHLTMQEGFYSNINKSYDRNIYNVIINSKIEPVNEKNRLFSTFDIFPTVLASLGAKIEGDRLGLGTNLFSDKETLIEKLGYNYFNEELKKKSFFYDNYLLGDTYYEMKNEK